MRPTRRVVLGGAASLVTGGLAGCTADGDASDSSRAFVSFYTLEAFTKRVTGDAMSVTNPVPNGEMGHRYAVGSKAQLDAARSTVFVYLDLDGFQDWALETAANFRRNRPEVTLVDATDGVDLRSAGDGHRHDDVHRQDEDAHAGVDPHFWLDPILAAKSVDTIAEALQAADQPNAEVYESNASAYRTELHDLADTYRSELDDRSLDTVVVAGHDSYQYLADRFGFSIHSPVGLSPNAEPGSAEIADTIALVNDRGIDAVLYDTFTSPQLAETILAESDASEAVPVTPVSGVKQSWADKAWGYVDQMKEINLPAFKTALNAND